ncbi:hypothetical protein HUT18_14040 [Streptomyces sp. NA04227]|uniref:hypothetical protein n=1 Tax=Streptomyces sp. NA04227 TaxID=2742136 RepID=UPI00159020CA|nr:hypothetical protein [Streptomyces sp. NA04227]QKW07341.1 hypothetical protein HUT18_14040 [Streptomyces sp. NA04227]
MKWLILGALLGLLIAFPSLLALVVALVAAVASQPVVVAFALGLVARPWLHGLRRWAR